MNKSFGTLQVVGRVDNLLLNEKMLDTLFLICFSKKKYVSYSVSNPFQQKNTLVTAYLIRFSKK